MTTCEYKLENGNCDNESLPEKRYCYWHLKTESKTPTIEQLQELKDKFMDGIYLQKANLSKANLQKANLWSARLQEANLLEVKLQKSILCNANLQKANLSKANLQEANLRIANLQEANLSKANLEKAQLVKIKLQKSILIQSNLQGADLTQANLQEANLIDANLQEANFIQANLRRANLLMANLQGANLSNVILQGANLIQANLQGANLIQANLQDANLSNTNFQGANLYGTMFNSKTNLINSNLTGSNLYRSYFDVAKSFRNIERFFENKGDKEINEIVGDSLKSNKILRKNYRFSFINKLNFFVLKNLKITILHLNVNSIILNYEAIERKEPEIASKLHGKGMFRYAGRGDKLLFFDINRELIKKNPENSKNSKFEEMPELTNCIIKDNLFQQDFLFQGKTDFYYEASYEVYNNLYNFYITNGRLDKAAEVHYRREDVNRKLRWEKGGWSKFRSIFDLLIVRGLTGYGDKIERPFILSFIFIFLFAVFFKLTDGIVKTVNGNIVEPGWIDYLYHSITTFTSLGYSNIQPNLAIEYWPQFLVSIESGLGIMMMALIIFVITYQVSR